MRPRLNGHRMNVIMSDDAMKKLERVKKRTDAESWTSVLRSALHLYDYATKAAGNGEEIVVRRKDGTEAVLVVLS